ncbi:MAG: hypothetical protein R8L53_03350 [Mariprofundales bacterium]
MNKKSFFIFCILASLLLVLITGCGRKTAPQVISNDAPPIVTKFKQAFAINALKISFVLTGGKKGVGYQIDRAEVDPYCDCINSWRRYLDIAPRAKNRDVLTTRIIHVPTNGLAYMYRLRAVDDIGRLGIWNTPIRVKSEAEE